MLKQETKFPYDEFTSLTVTAGQSAFSLMVRYPSWARQEELQLWINGKPVTVQKVPGSSISPSNEYGKKGDIVKIRLPMEVRTEAMPNQPEYLAFMYGPVLLAAGAGQEGMKGLVADDSRWAHIAGGKDYRSIRHR
ncbi:MAG: glycoside hydrolase family 127 protein [Chitinophagaceae bacterium]|nr:glycoside hydrolase family 127 protein [Chitinophagaceae bacterium]